MLRKSSLAYGVLKIFFITSGTNNSQTNVLQNSGTKVVDEL